MEKRSGSCAVRVASEKCGGNQLLRGPKSKLTALPACMPLNRDFSEDPGIRLDPGIIVSKLTVKHDIFSDSKTLLDFWHFFSKILRPAIWPERKFPINCQNFVLILVQKRKVDNPVSNPNLRYLYTRLWDKLDVSC